MKFYSLLNINYQKKDEDVQKKIIRFSALFLLLISFFTFMVWVSGINFWLPYGSAAAANGPQLSISSNIPANPNSTVVVPVLFTSNGSQISSTVFSIDYDETWLSFDETVSNAIDFSLPSDFSGQCIPDQVDTDGEIDCFIIDPLVPLVSLPDSVVLNITLRTKSPISPVVVKAGFSTNSPQPSFTSTSGQAVAGTAVDGSVALTSEDGRTTILISVSSDEIQGNVHSVQPSISYDGRYIAFMSDANNLAAGDLNLTSDIFVRDRLEGKTVRASVHSTGIEGNGQSMNPSISDDGRFVAFSSVADNLVDNDLNETGDVFIHNLITTQTSRVSVSSTGTESNDGSGRPSISLDGRYVAFNSQASNLVENDTNTCGGANYCNDIFVHDRVTGETIRVSVSSSGEQSNNRSPHYGLAISGNGRFVAFDSIASNLVPSDTNTCGSYSEPGTCSDIFVHDIQTGKTVRVSVASDGTQANDNSRSPDISADGRYVTFYSKADNLVSGDSDNNYDVFVHDRDVDNDSIFDEPGEVSTSLVSVKSDGTQSVFEDAEPVISANGRYVAFYSLTPLVPEDNNGVHDVYVHDRKSGETVLVSATWEGLGGNSWSSLQSISGDGNSIAFRANSSNLVAYDVNNMLDIFVYGTPFIRFEEEIYDANENINTVNISVNLEAASSSTVSVYYHTADGTAVEQVDYISASGLVLFNPGVISQTIPR